jgi:hypothetical protein
VVLVIAIGLVHALDRGSIGILLSIISRRRLSVTLLLLIWDSYSSVLGLVDWLSWSLLIYWLLVLLRCVCWVVSCMYRWCSDRCRSYSMA